MKNAQNDDLPLVSVLMPCFNAALYLKESIESILNQTYQKLEFVIIDDGSTDGSWSILESYQVQEKRIKLHKNQENLGLIATLNKGIPLCKGKYIARMDADDISLPERLEKQVDFLEKYNEYALVGTGYTFFSEHQANRRFVLQCLEMCSSLINVRSLFYTPFNHASILIRNEVMQTYFYDDEYPIAEDYELFTRIIKSYKGANLQEVLMHIREAIKSNSRSNVQQQLSSVKKIYQNQLDYYNIPYSEQELSLHLLLSESNATVPSIKELNEIVKWLILLKNFNQANHFFPQNTFNRTLAIVWYKTCNKSASLGWKTFFVYRKYIFHKYGIPIRAKYIFLMKCMGLGYAYKQYLKLKKKIVL